MIPPQWPPQSHLQYSSLCLLSWYPGLLSIPQTHVLRTYLWVLSQLLPYHCSALCVAGSCIPSNITLQGCFP